MNGLTELPYQQRYVTGARWLDLLATSGSADSPHPKERIVGVSALRGWLEAHRLTPRARPTEADVAATQRLRENLRTLAQAALAGDASPPKAVTGVRRMLAADEAPRLLRTAVGVRLAAPPTTEVALACLTREAVTDMASERLGQLHGCEGETCSALYLDPTGRRRWCSTEVCGNRHRVRRSRDRARSSASMYVGARG